MTEKPVTPIDWIFSTKEEKSLDDQLWAIKDKISKLLNNTPPNGVPVWAAIPKYGDSAPTFWVSNLYSDYAIVSKNGVNYRQNYHIDENDNPVLDGEMFEVVSVWVPKTPGEVQGI